MASLKCIEATRPGGYEGSVLAEVQALPDCSHTTCPPTCQCAESECASQLADGLADVTCAQLQGCVAFCACGDKTCLADCAVKTPSSKALAPLE